MGGYFLIHQNVGKLVMFDNNSVCRLIFGAKKVNEPGNKDAMLNLILDNLLMCK